jgi:3D (Asp-Asp-Asp) domain-containing protein
MIKKTNVFIGILLVFFPYKCNIHKLEPVNEIQIESVYDEIPDIVTLTTYSVEGAQTDSTPLLTASGFKINPNNPKRHRIIAVSRDLKRKYKFGERVVIVGAGRLDGEYVIRDLMHQRWKNKIDILINPNDRHTKLRKIKMYRVKNK